MRVRWGRREEWVHAGESWIFFRHGSASQSGGGLIAVRAARTMNTVTAIERELETILLQRYEQWKQIGYCATYFRRMLNPSDPIFKGPVGTVRHLLRKKLTEKSGFIRLRKAGKLELSVEALFQGQQAWHSLFIASEIDKARERCRSAKPA